MDNRTINMLFLEMLCKLRNIASTEELEAFIAECTANLQNTEAAAMSDILSEYRSIATELITQRRLLKNIDPSNHAELTEKEQEELDEANRVIDENLFDYHFQPIISVASGDIYSYEALMRPRSSICPSPFHILKYAELSDRLDDIERVTFFNVLSIAEDKKSILGKRKIFMNSIPEARFTEDDLARITELLERNSDTVVVEMTEESEITDDYLEMIKQTYERLNIQVAVDDYGTGYSNVQNLLRYMPDYVKIDRSLISGIQSDAKKKHFVREIIDFCHDNSIIALAEGVETSEELHTVIHLGADLIQGYYTARPAAEIIDAVPYEIAQEIKSCYQERVDGRRKHIYSAENKERVLLDRLMNDKYDCIQINKDCPDVTVSGEIGMETPIHIDIKKGYIGTLVLDNAILSNIKDRPCIDIEDDCDVIIILSGENRLRYGGIRVPKSSKLTICGDGMLDIHVEAGAFYGIGNDIDSEHGELIFEQGVVIHNFSASCVGIGSGSGGKIVLRRGKFDIDIHSAYGIGIGSYSSNAELELYAVDVSVYGALERGAAVGTLTGSLQLNAEHCALKVRLSGKEVVGFGSLSGDNCDIRICEAGANVDISADIASGFGSMKGNTIFELSRASSDIKVTGIKALAIGGFEGNTSITTTYADVSMKLNTQLSVADYFKRENINVTGGRLDFILNDHHVDDMDALWTSEQ